MKIHWNVINSVRLFLGGFWFIVGLITFFRAKVGGIFQATGFEAKLSAVLLMIYSVYVASAILYNKKTGDFSWWELISLFSAFFLTEIIAHYIVIFFC